MSVVFVSFDRMGWACLDKILALGGNVVAIVTLEDQLLEKRSKFQGFEDIAGKAQAPLLKCKNINQPEIIDALAKLHPDIIFIIDRCTAPVRLGSGPERTPSAVY
ncbi:MAG: hypothetical protein QGD94_02020 [Planctomycetia bacterium]|nr:hypothetical protein [Planctomycetia bacterium]